MKNETRFKENMTVLCELFDKPVSKLLMGSYWKALESFTDEECEKAFNELALSSRFFPKLADFIEALSGTKKDQAFQAWLKVIDAVRRVGNYQSVKFNDPVIHSVFKFWGGWDVTTTPDWDGAQLKWKQKEFEQLYAVMSHNSSHPEYLPGKSEIDDAAKGYDRKHEIVLIGFESKEEQKRIVACEGPVETDSDIALERQRLNSCRS